MMNYHLKILNLLLLFITLSACRPASQREATTVMASSSSVLDKVLSRQVLRVGTTGDFKPFSYQKDENSDMFYGVDIALAADLAQSLGAELQLVKTSWPTLLDDLEAGKFDIGMSGITIKLARQQRALFSIPLLASGKAPITRDENVEKFQTIADINQAGVRVIVNPGGTNESFAREHFPQATIVQNEDNLSIFQRIVDGDADLMVTDAIETKIQELLLPELEAVHPDEPFNFFEMGYLLPRDHTFKAYVDQWLNLRLKDGTYDAIFAAELQKIKTSKK